MKNKQIVKEAVEREIQLGKFLLARYAEKLSKLEKKYKMKSEDFIKKFESGKLGDKEEYFEWYAIFMAKKHWEEKLNELEKTIRI